MTRKQLDVNLLGADIIADPYPMYEQIRSMGNVVWNGLLNAWTCVGYDTTAKTMANTLIALAANPDQRRLVAGGLSLVPAAIEESMRWYGSVQPIPRQAVSDTMVGGTAVAAGESVHVFVAGGNRDPRRWADPDKFDATRERKTHLAFGRGPHLCLGAALARIEVKVAIARLLEVVPNYELHNIDFGHAFFIRGPETGLVTAGS